MKKQDKTILTVAAIAAGALLLSKKPVSGVGGMFSSNKKLNTVLQSIFDDLSRMGRREVKHYMREFPREIDYNIVQYGNLLAYYYDVRQMYLNAGYSPRTLGSDQQLWETYKRQVGWVARNFVNMLPEDPED